MIKFRTTILKFDAQGEKTGWTYIEIPAATAHLLMPDNKKSFRVKGLLDSYAIKGTALMPMGGGNFIMALNASLRRGIKKRKGALLDVQIEIDNEQIITPSELVQCLADEPVAKAFFNSLTKSHQHYFIKWIESAKTEPTKVKRIAQIINALSKKIDFGLMLRSAKQDKDELLGR